MNLIDLLKIIKLNLRKKDSFIQLFVYLLFGVFIVYVGDFLILCKFILWSISISTTSGFITDTYSFLQNQNKRNTFRFVFSLMSYFIIIWLDINYLNVQIFSSSIVLGIIISFVTIYNFRNTNND